MAVFLPATASGILPHDIFPTSLGKRNSELGEKPPKMVEKCTSTEHLPNLEGVDNESNRLQWRRRNQSCF